MMRSIAVTTDFSGESRQAFHPAAALARKLGASLQVLHLAEGPQIYVPWQTQSPQSRARWLIDLESQLEALVAEEPAFAGLAVEHRVLEGPSPDSLVLHLDEQRVDLLVMATHGHAGLNHFLLGSFTARILEISTSPVLVVRTTRGAVGASGAAFHPTRILVPYDFSEPAKAALEESCEWARAFGAELRLLFVLEPHPSAATASGAPDAAGDFHERSRKEAEVKLAAVASAEARDVASETVVRVGRPAAEIIEEAKQHRSHLIVMSSRGLSILDRFALGSVAERTIQGAGCPVLLVRRGARPT